MKQYRSPEEVLKTIAPPKCTIGLNHSDHRWTSSWKIDTSSAPFPYNQKTMTKSFWKVTSWQNALSAVHAWNWKKWAHLKEHAPLPSGEMEQQPGSIPATVLDELQLVVDKLPAPKKYQRQS